MLAGLMHPQIIRVLDFYMEQATPVLVMDYASGGTLRQRHPRGSYLALETTVAYVKQLAAALQYAHNTNIIHRDVKPENMLLGANQRVLLGDFGISLFAPSPEQLTSQEMGGTVPIWLRSRSAAPPALRVINMPWASSSMNGSVDRAPLRAPLSTF